MTPKDSYLVLYNLACCLGWLSVLVLSLLSLAKNAGSIGIQGALANIYNASLDTINVPMSLMLSFTQTAAVMEIIHAAIGFVRSPVLVTFLQVSSRLIALFAIYTSINAQSKFFIAKYVGIHAIMANSCFGFVSFISLNNSFRSMGCRCYDDIMGVSGSTALCVLCGSIINR
jgi:Protein tyrosine phosphatase-like protein, PTPLA